MLERPIISQQFSQQLAYEGFPVGQIEQDMEKTGNVISTIRNWTNYPDKVIREGLWNEDREEILPMIAASLRYRLQPWLETGLDTDLPSVSLLEISRDLRDQEFQNGHRTISLERIARIISRYPITISIHGSVYTSDIQVPEFPKNTLLDMTSGRQYNVSPKRIAKLGRHPSYTHGSRKVEKSRLDTNTINSAVRREALARAEVSFKPVEDSEAESEFGVMAGLSTSNVVKTQKVSLEETVYSQPNGRDLMKALQWFKKNGFGKNWVLGNRESLLAEKLVGFSQGKPTDFVIWNCIGFQWFTGQNGEFPTCNITDNLDAAITLYFKDKIREVASTLSSLGDPQIIILVPSNEALDGYAWNYRQSYEEREEILNQAVDGLTQGFTDTILPDNASLKVMRWDDYLSSRNVSRNPQEYSREGERKVRESDIFGKIVQEAIESGRSYFFHNGITNIADDVFAKRQPRYYGVYAGEGVAFKELQEHGRNIVVVNFEEMRVSQMSFLGAQGTLPIVTPVSGKEMVRYYQWETRQIQKRQ